eukprot:TRINITY_DN687_c0_g3_i1.p1 TRINITY_DN687_c0_g3~~TRINITY_DN687_c0_g3_i1.p1  ORF type:complete len:295 (+),score=57.60 TRINITY_DN687_c0_g3_i1:79-963(+)
MSFADAEGGRRGGGARGGWGGSYQDTTGRSGGGRASNNQYDQLTQLVSNNVKQINYNVAQINRMVNSIGVANKDSAELRGQMSDLIESTRSLALDTNKGMKELSRLPGGESSESKRLQSKLKNDFQSCLERFQEISKLASKKASSSAPPKSAPGNSGGSRPWQDDSDEDEKHGLMESQKRQQLMQLEGERDYQHAIVEERDAGIRQIESTIQEVNDIFVDLAHLVQEQAPMIDNIESHIDSAVSSTSKGVVELRKAAEYQDSARTKMCCIVLVILIIVAIVIAALVLGVSFGLK